MSAVVAMPSLLLRHNVSVPDLQTYYTELWSGSQASFSSSQARGWLTDLELVGNTEMGWGSIMVHKAVILTLCPYLAYLLREVDDSKVIFTDVSLEVVKSVVQLIYTGECSLKVMADVEGIMDLARSLGLLIHPDKLQLNLTRQENTVTKQAPTMLKRIEIEANLRENLVTETIEHVVSMARSNPVEIREESLNDINSNDVKGVLRRKSIEPRFFCDHCKFECRFWIQLVEHSNADHAKRKFQCKKCDFKTSKLMNVKLHDRSVHIGKGSFTCDVCGFKASSPAKLVWHQKFQHKQVVKKQIAKEKRKKLSTLPPKEVSRKKLGDKTPSVETLPCHACQFQTFYKQSLRKHIIRFHGNEEIS